MREFVCVRSVAAVSGNWEMVLTFAANRSANGLLVRAAFTTPEFNGFVSLIFAAGYSVVKNAQHTSWLHCIASAQWVSAVQVGNATAYCTVASR